METKRVQFNPLDITESLGYQTFRRDSRKPWTAEEDKKLHGLINDNLFKLGYDKGIEELNKNEELVGDVNWDEISELMGATRKSRDCRKRWVNSLNPNLKKGKWTSNEDQKLLESFEKFGSSWQKIANEIPGRTEDQCAKRYIEVLDPNTKDRLRPWTLNEDLSLIKKVKSYGTKWRTISMEMESRPSLTCRNRWRKIVTDVVRGKANIKIKEEIDSIQGGLSKVEELSETFQNKKYKKERESTGVSSTHVDNQIESNHDTKMHLKREGQLPQSGNASLSKYAQFGNNNNSTNNNSDNHTNSTNTTTTTTTTTTNNNNNDNNSQPQINYAGPVNGLNEESPKPISIEMDWKYTLKDTSGLTLSNGNISSDDLAKQLIENAKKYDLKISIHQHIHHHYGSTNNNNVSTTNSKAQSPDTSSNLSGNNNRTTATTEDLAYRYSHFNYLPPMAQTPHLQSSNLTSRENELNKLLNPSSGSVGHSIGHHTYQPSNHRGNKRRLSRDVKTPHPRLDNQEHTYEELEDELDFWETMRSLSQFNTNNPISKKKSKDNSRNNSTGNHSHSNGNDNDGHNNNNDDNVYENDNDDDDDSDGIEFYYGMEETVQKDMGFPGPMLPFNPS